MNKIKIGIAEDQALFRRGIVSLLDSYENFSVIVEAENGKDLIEEYSLIENSQDGKLPDITILDLRMPVMDGIKTTEYLKKNHPDSKVIIISAHDDEDIIVHLYERGANAFIDKNAEPEEVELAIKSVIENDFYFNEAAKKALDDASAPNSEAIHFTIVDKLSSREVDVLRLLCKAKSSQDISEELSISKRTVDNHRNKLLQKTGAKNSTGLVLFAIQTNLINTSELKINPS